MRFLPAAGVMVPSLIILSCGDTAGIPDESITSIELDSDSTIILMPVDTLGQECGDSAYVFGALEAAAFCPDGNIAALDRGRSLIRIYSPEGEYLRSIGGRGIGPGELGSVTFMAITEDGHIHVSGEGGGEYGVHTYLYETGEWIDSRLTAVPPSCLTGMDGDRYIRKDITFFAEDGNIYLPVTVAVYGTGMDEAEMVVHADTVLFDPTMERELLELDWYGFDIAVFEDARIYISPRSTERALVYIFDGSTSRRIGVLELPFRPVRRTEEEMDMERHILRAKALASNESPEGLEPDPFKPLIRGLETDSAGNLWILQGGPFHPTFTVLDPCARHLGTGTLSWEPADGGSWRFHFGSAGVLAYAEDPATGFQQVYLLGISHQ